MATSILTTGAAPAPIPNPQPAPLGPEDGAAAYLASLEWRQLEQSYLIDLERRCGCFEMGGEL